LVVANLVPADARDRGQLREHPHGLAIDGNVPGAVPLELAVAPRREREAFGVGFHAESQWGDGRPECLKGRALLSGHVDTGRAPLKYRRRFLGGYARVREGESGSPPPPPTSSHVSVPRHRPASSRVPWSLCRSPFPSLAPTVFAVTKLARARGSKTIRRPRRT